jgi:hypothetical protein
MEYKTLSNAQKKELITYELSKSVEYFMVDIDETINKYNLLNRPNSAYTKVHLTISEACWEFFGRGQYDNIIFDKFYPLFSVKQDFSTDFIANLSSILNSIESNAIWGIKYDICFFNSDGTPNGAITEFHINPDAFKQEFLKLKGWEQYIA